MMFHVINKMFKCSNCVHLESDISTLKITNRTFGGIKTGRLVFRLTAFSRVLFEKLNFFQLVQKLPAFMEPESSLPYTQVPATCPYPETAPIGPHHPLPLPEYPA
jgi:hypothetical protein